MAGKQSKFMIGIFVTGGILLAVAAMVWLGASKYFEKGMFFVTYFDESVQGLSVDSNVKYRGVNVGTVRSIQVAPDHKLVEVVMKIAMQGGDERNLTAKLKSAGLTGIVFVELDQKIDENINMSPEIKFATKYLIIPSRPSDSKYILSMVDSIVSEMNKMDFKSMFQELRGITGGINQYVNSPGLKNIVDNLESTTAHLDRAIRQIDKLTAEGKLDDILKEARGTITDARALIGKMKDDFSQMKLAESAGKANEAVAGIDQSVRQITFDLKNTTDNLQRASENLDIMIDKLRDDPSDLLFSRPPPVSPRER